MKIILPFKKALQNPEISVMKSTDKSVQNNVKEQFQCSIQSIFIKIYTRFLTQGKIKRKVWILGENKEIYSIFG